MAYGSLPIALSVIFMVLILALIGSYLYVRIHHRAFRHRSSPPPPILTRNETPDFSITNTASTKEMLYFFYLKPLTPVKLDPLASPNKNKDESSTDDHMVDVTIKEEDKEEVESTPDVDSLIKQVEVEDQVAVTVDRDDGDTKTVFSTPCDSPVFFTPVGSPVRDFVESEFVVAVHENENCDDR